MTPSLPQYPLLHAYLAPFGTPSWFIIHVQCLIAFATTCLRGGTLAALDRWRRRLHRRRRRREPAVTPAPLGAALMAAVAASALLDDYCSGMGSGVSSTAAAASMASTAAAPQGPRHAAAAAAEPAATSCGPVRQLAAPHQRSHSAGFSCLKQPQQRPASCIGCRGASTSGDSSSFACAVPLAAATGPAAAASHSWWRLRRSSPSVSCLQRRGQVQRSAGQLGGGWWVHPITRERPESGGRGNHSLRGSASCRSALQLARGRSREQGGGWTEGA